MRHPLFFLITSVAFVAYNQSTLIATPLLPWLPLLQGAFAALVFSQLQGAPHRGLPPLQAWPGGPCSSWYYCGFSVQPPCHPVSRELPGDRGPVPTLMQSSVLLWFFFPSFLSWKIETGLGQVLLFQSSELSSFWTVTFLILEAYI